MASKARRAGLYNKDMLKAGTRQAFDAWLLDDPVIMGTDELRLPSVPKSPFVSASAKEDVYVRSIMHGREDADSPLTIPEHFVSFIQKNNKPFCFTWTTSAEKLRQGVRWGIIPAESVTAKVMGALGHYRVIEHERIVKGLISNTHRSKLALLDHYQDRFEALQELESLINKNNSATAQQEFEQALQRYVRKLRDIQYHLASRQLGSDISEKMHTDMLADLQQDIEDEIENAKNCASDDDAILAFIKQQITDNLDKMQGINEDISYSTDKTFALTRGAMNDCIEDARKIADDYEADPRNLLTAKHHGNFAEEDKQCVYNFKKDHLTPEREREVLLAISFIEEWDTVEYTEKDIPQLHVAKRKPKKRVLEQDNSFLIGYARYHLDENKKQELVTRHKQAMESADAARLADSFRDLTVTAATNWRSSAGAIVFFKKIGWVIANALLSVIGRTQTIDENAWQSKDENGKYKFKAYATDLRRSAYVRTYDDNDPWYIKAIKLIFPRRAKFDKEAPWYKKIERTLLGINIYLPYDSFFRKFKAIFIRLKTVIFSEAVTYRGARPNDPLWYKPFYFFKMLGSTGANVFIGFWDFVRSIVNLIRFDIYYDYKSAKPLPEWKKLQEQAQEQIDDIKNDFALYMNEVNKLIRARKHRDDQDAFKGYRFDFNHKDKLVEKKRIHARLPYHWGAAQQNDLVNAVVRGVDGFASFFTHNFTKDPAGALAFGAVYVMVGGSILLPKMFSFLGTAFANWAQTLGLSVASGGASSAVASACLVGQWGWGIVDVIEHGPQSGCVKTIKLVLDDPLTIGAGITTAWIAGHLLTITIPVVQHDLGRDEDIGKLGLGGKAAVALYEIFQKPQQNKGEPIKFKVDGTELELKIEELTPEQKLQHEKFRSVVWLMENQAMLSMLSEGVKRKLGYHFGELFKDDQKRNHSIAHQIITIPLSYIPAVIRALASCVSSVITCSINPMKIAWTALGKKILKDLCRLLVAAERLSHLIGNLTTTPIKILVDLVNMSVGRIFALFGIRTGHSSHTFFAICRNGFRLLSELFPIHVMKYITVEHPYSAVQRLHDAQLKMYKTLGVESIAPVNKSQDDTKPVIIDDDEDIGAGVGFTAVSAISSFPVPSFSRSSQQ